MIGVDREEEEIEIDADDEVDAVTVARLALLRFPGTLPMREMEKAHFRRRFEQRWQPVFSPEQRTWTRSDTPGEQYREGVPWPHDIHCKPIAIWVVV